MAKKTKKELDLTKKFEKQVEKQSKKQVEKARKSKNKILSSSSPTLKLISDKEIAMDFAAKVYKKFTSTIKSIILFGSTLKDTSTSTSDIDIVIIIDDASIAWDQELIAWYREELGKLVKSNPYKKDLHINTVKLTTWWQHLIHGDPVVLNILRYGQAMIDFGGFFNPLKVLLERGKIRATPEAIYTALQRAPQHLARSKSAELGSVEGVYWAMVDSAHAALIAAKQLPPSPEHIPIILKETFVDKKMLKMKYVLWYRDLYVLHRKIVHREISDLKGVEIDLWQQRADEFIRVMAELIKKIVK
jgi:predicted nucleotidyltransferase